MKLKISSGKWGVYVGSFSLIEILLAISLFAIVTAPLTLSLVDILRANKNMNERVSKIFLIQKEIESIYAVKSESWAEIIRATATGAKHIELENGVFKIKEGTKNIDGLSFDFVVNRVFKNPEGDLVESGGVEDIHSRRIDIRGSWKGLLGVNKSYSHSFYVSDWNTLLWEQSLDSEFLEGTHSGTKVTKDSDGEVKLERVVYADWCKPKLSLTTFDVTGNGIVSSISAEQGRIVTSTGGNSSSYSFFDISVTTDRPPVLKLERTYDGYKVNDIFIKDHKIYLATDSNSEEVVILDFNGKIGSVDLPGSTDADGIFVTEDSIYVLQGSSLRIIDIASRLVVGSFALGGIGTDIFVRDNYAYVTLKNSLYELLLINVAIRSNPVFSAWLDINNGIASTVNVSEDGNTVYVGTPNSIIEREFFVVDARNKSGTLSVIYSYDSKGTSIRGIALVRDRVIIVGTGGEEYRVLNSADYSYCGGMQVDSGLYGIAALKDAKGNAYSYVISKDPGSEIKVIQGGAGGGGNDGLGYLETGEFISSVLDTTSVAPVFTSLEWIESKPSKTNIKFQLRSSDSLTGLESAEWIGKDGTSSSYFTTAEGNSIYHLSLGKQFIQYKAVLSTEDVENTPVLEAVKLRYVK